MHILASRMRCWAISFGSTGMRFNGKVVVLFALTLRCSQLPRKLSLGVAAGFTLFRQRLHREFVIDEVCRQCCNKVKSRQNKGRRCLWQGWCHVQSRMSFTGRVMAIANTPCMLTHSTGFRNGIQREFLGTWTNRDGDAQHYGRYTRREWTRVHYCLIFGGNNWQITNEKFRTVEWRLPKSFTKFIPFPAAMPVQNVAANSTNSTLSEGDIR